MKIINRDDVMFYLAQPDIYYYFYLLGFKTIYILNNIEDQLK